MNRYERTRKDHAKETAEDYVELVQGLIRERGEARAVDLAEKLGVSQVTVSKTVKRLSREGYLHAEPYRSIFLTAKGEATAQASRDRHRVVVECLRCIGVPEEAAEADAEGIEHHVSHQTLEAMRKFVEAAG